MGCAGGRRCVCVLCADTSLGQEGARRQVGALRAGPRIFEDGAGVQCAGMQGTWVTVSGATLAGCSTA